MANSFLASVEYPDSDGEPMADNTLQWDTIAYLVTAVRRWYADRADVFVAGDLLWYFEEGKMRHKYKTHARLGCLEYNLIDPYA